MDLIDIYASMQRGDLNVEEAARMFGLAPRAMKFRLTRWGHRLPLLLAVLDKIRKDEISRDEAAETLGVSTREVNHLMMTWKVDRPVKQYLVLRAAAGVKWELRKKFAIDYIAGSTTIEDAAEAAGVSTRQMRRWVSELLQKHFGMVWKDLKDLPDRKRYRLADEIETAENLESDKHMLLKEISEGVKDIKAVAVERVSSRRSSKRRHV